MPVQIRRLFSYLVMVVILICSASVHAQRRVKEDRETPPSAFPDQPSDRTGDRRGNGTDPMPPEAPFPTPDAGTFSLEQSEFNFVLVKGQTRTVTVRVVPSGGFTDPVTITTSGSIPGGSVSNTPTILSPPYDQLSTITVSATNSTPSGFYSININATGGSVSKTGGLSIEVAAPGVGSFNTFLSPTSVNVVKGAGFATRVQTSTSGDFTGPIQYTISGLPDGITVSGLPHTAQGPGFGSFAVVFTASSTIEAGTYTSAVLTGTAGSQTVTKPIPITVSATATGDYTFRVEEGQIWVDAGGRRLVTLTVTSFGGFSGVVTVHHSVSQPSISIFNKTCPPASSCPIQDIPFNVPAGGSVSEQVIVEATASSPGGSVLFTTSTPALPNKGPFSYGVSIGPQAPGISIGASQLNPTIPQGGSFPVTVNLTRKDGFTGAVTANVTTDSSGFTFTGAPLVFAPGETSKVLTIHIGSSVVPATNHNVSIFASVPEIPDSAGSTIVVNVTPAALAPDFTLSAVPAALTIAQGGNGNVSLVLTRTGGFAGTVTVTTLQSNGINVVSPITFAVTETTRLVNIGASISAPSGPGSVDFTGTSTSLPLVNRTARVDLNITATAQPDFTVALDPAAMTLTQGTTGTATFTLNRINGFSGPVNVTVSAPGGITIDPLTFTLQAGETSRLINVAALNSAAVGPNPITFSAVAPSIPRTLTTTLQLAVSQASMPANFTIAATPATTTMTAGDTRTITLTLTRQNFSGVVQVTAAATPGIIVPAIAFAATETTRDVSVVTTQNTPAGPGSIDFTATATDLPGQTRTVSVALTVLSVPVAGAPVITGITPSGTTAGARSMRVFLTGQNFAFGAAVLSSDSGIRIESTEVELATVASVILSVEPFTPAGRYRIDLRNPTGAITAEGIDFLVYDEDDIGAPLGVTASAIISPMSRKTISLLERPNAVAIVAATGSGTISGRWLLDGSTFDQFTITVSSGEPTIITSRTPIPASFAGSHRLQLVIDSPQYTQSAAIDLMMAVETRTNLTILGPYPSAGAAATTGEPLTLRWSMVPGALGYEVQLEKNARPFGRPIAVGQEAEVMLEWNQLASDDLDPTLARQVFSNELPSPMDMDEIERSSFRWRVAPTYCCSGSDFYPGGFSEWAELPITARSAQTYQLDAAAQDRAIAAAIPSRLRQELGGGPGDAAQTSAPATRTATAIPSARPSAISRMRKDFAILPMATSSYKHQSETEEGLLQISGQGDLGLPPLSSKYTSDITGTDFYGENFTVAGSRNWVVNAGNAQRSKRLVRPEAIIGYAPPDFFRGTQLVTSALARGGALVRAVSKFGTASYYSTFTDALDGLITGNFGMQQKIDAAAFELPAHKRYSFKILSLRVEDLPLSSQFAPRGEGRSIGFLGTYNVSPKLQITAEGARGDSEWMTTRGRREREGDAFRIGLNGYLGRRSYRFDLSRTDADFVNPANRGFTTAALPNRTIGAFTYTNPIGRGSATVTLRHQLQSRTDADSTASGINLSYNAMLSSRVSVSAAGNYNQDRADANLATRLPGTDRSQLGTSLTFSETVGRLNFSQTVSHQELRDEINHNAARDTDTITLTGGGALGAHMQLHAATTLMRMTGTSASDNLLLSLTPSFTIPNTYLSIAPRISYNYSSNEIYDSRNINRGEQYSTLLQWSPTWLTSLAAFQLSANWDRNNIETALHDTSSMTRSYVGTFTLKWGAGIGPATFRRNRASELPVASAVPTSQDPVNGRTAGRK